MDTKMQRFFVVFLLLTGEKHEKKNEVFVFLLEIIKLYL